MGRDVVHRPDMAPRQTLDPRLVDLLRRSPGRVASTRTILAETGIDRFAIAELVKLGFLDRLQPAHVRLAGDEAPHQLGHLAATYLDHHRPGEPFALSGLWGLATRQVDVVGARRGQTDAPEDPIRRAGIPTSEEERTAARRAGRRPLALVLPGRKLEVCLPAFDLTTRADLRSIRIERLHGLPLAELAVAIADGVEQIGRDEDGRRALLYRVLNRLQPDRAALIARWATMAHPGARWLLEQAAMGVLEHDSPAERALFEQVFRPFGPLPDCQVWLSDGIRVDYAYLFAGLVIERNGEEEHANQVVRDGTREYAKRSMGYETITIVRGMDRDPAALAAHIHATRRHREQLVLEGRLPRAALPVQRDRLVPLRTLIPSG
jgi:hypothetical protein